MDPNYSPLGQGWPPEQKPSIGTGEGETPLAKPNPEKNEMRTMASDISSMQESGGVTPRPYVPPPTPIGRPAELESKPSFGAPNMESGLPPNFPFGDGEIKQAPKPPAPPNIPGAAMAVAKPKSKKGLIIVVVAIVLVIALGIFSYLFFFVGEEVPPPQENVQLLPANNLPLVENVPPNDNLNPPVTPGAPEESALPILVHTTYFKKAANSVQETKFDPFALSQLQEAFGAGVSETAELKELVLKNTEDKIIELEEIFRILWPDLFDPKEMAAVFERDYTVFSYVDKNGTWPGIVLKHKGGIVDTTAKQQVQNAFEKSGGAEILANLYPLTPGVPETWKQGKTGAVANRYLVFSKPGSQVSLNYAWTGNKLVISASYDGFKAALNGL